MQEDFIFKNKLLILRVHRLGHLPPALAATELIVEQGIPVVVVEYERLKEDTLLVPGPVPRRRFESPFARYFPRFLRPLAIHVMMFFRLGLCFLREGIPRLVMAHGLHEQCLARALKWFFRVPYAVHVHEVYDKKDLSGINRLFLAFEKRSLREADFLIFPEKSRSEIYVRRYRLKSPIYILPNCPRLRKPVKPIDLKRHFNLPPDAVVLAYMGGIGPDNAILEGVEAAAQVPQLYFLIWGWGNESYVQKLKTKARALKMEKRLLLLGELDADKWEHLEGCDVSYCVYIPEKLRLKFAATASNKLMEALACGIPVITNGQPDFRDIVEQYDVGICVESLSVSGIASAMKLFAEDEIKRKRQSENSRALHREVFHYEKFFPPVLEKLKKYDFSQSSPKRDASFRTG